MHNLYDSVMFMVRIIDLDSVLPINLINLI